VSADGTLDALSAGKAEITARNGLDKSVSRILSVTVYGEEDFYPKPELSKLPSMRLDETLVINSYSRIFNLLLSVGDKCLLQVKGSFYSENPTIDREYYNLTGTQFGTVYSSDDPSVATVSDDGRLEARSPGTVRITADNESKGYKAQGPVTWYVEVIER
jgi:hypothetical protein